MRATTLARELVDFFLPAACLGCRDHLPLERSGELVCGACRTRLRAPTSPRCRRCGCPLGSGSDAGAGCLECAQWGDELVGARAAVVLRPPADALVYALKYGGWCDLAGLMGRRMARHAVPPELGSGPYLVVPVPTTSRRMRERGYNQARVLAGVLAGEVDRPLVEALERRGKGPTQVGLHPGQRKANVLQAFAVRDAAMPRLSGARVLLVDDVLTTGSTAQAAARPLIRAGAAQVFLTTFARAFPYT